MNQPLQQPSGTGSDWKNILWREWRYSADEGYAEQIFNLLADQPVGWGSLVSVALLGTLYGQLVGLLLRLLPVSTTLPAPLAEGSMALFVWLGGILGGAGALLLGGSHLSWRTWLNWLTPTPYLGKSSDRSGSEWWIGGIIGLAGFGIWMGALAGFLVSIFLGRKFEMSRGNEYIAGSLAGAIAGAIGALIGGLAGYGGNWGAALGLIFGFWSGIVWSSGLIGVTVGWLSVIIGWLLFGVGDWMTGWLGLSLGYGLGAIGNVLSYRSDMTDKYPLRFFYFWWRGQPLLAKVEAALQLALTARPKAQVVWANPLASLEQYRRPSAQPEVFIKMLQNPDWADRFAARQALVALGGEASTALQRLATDTAGPEQPLALWILNSIEQDTTHRLAWRLSRLLCPRCLARFRRRAVNLPWGVAFHYYGCRSCGQSREFLEWASQVVAVLDQNWSELQVQQDEQFRINWLKRRSLFDFDRVEIIRASDEEVERFAVQVGNDTDSYRRLRYQQMSCRIGSKCRLSENTLRILNRMFGRVERGNNAKL